MSIDEWIGKEDVLYVYTHTHTYTHIWILFGYKKANVAICKEMDGPLPELGVGVDKMGDGVKRYKFPIIK